MKKEVYEAKVNFIGVVYQNLVVAEKKKGRDTM